MAKQTVIDRMKSFLLALGECWVLLMGDFNFIHDDDTRLDVLQQRHVPDHDPLAAYVERKFTDYTEFFQPDFTRRRVAEKRVIALSRIDRVYTNIPASELLDLSVVASTYKSPLDLSVPSDHVGVVASLRHKSSRRKNSRACVEAAATTIGVCSSARSKRKSSL